MEGVKNISEINPDLLTGIFVFINKKYLRRTDDGGLDIQVIVLYRYSNTLDLLSLHEN